MSIRERILAVYRGETPDAVPFMLDLSHWFYHKRGAPWDISKQYDQPEHELIDYHKRKSVGFYIPNLGSFFGVDYESGVRYEVSKGSHEGREEITWRIETPVGAIERARVWHIETYSWAISRWGVITEQDLRVLGYALSRRRFTPRWERYRAWTDAVGDSGVVYLPLGYSALGQLLNYWMGIERTTYATFDWPETLHEVVDEINEANLALVGLLADSPAEVILMGDNFSGDVQPPAFFDEWSRPFYVEAIRRLHEAGKFVAVHIDGRLAGALEMIRDAGADAADAVTPTPMGDLTPEQCRDRAGPDFILSGGVSPELWLPDAPVERFERAVLAWLDLKTRGPRFIANAGDQVPPGAVEERIDLMRELVEAQGGY